MLESVNMVNIPSVYDFHRTKSSSEAAFAEEGKGVLSD